MCAALDRPITADELDELATIIHRTHRAHLRELRLEWTEGGVVLIGRSGSYYGKQMAQEEVLHRGLAVVANEVIVAQIAFEQPAVEFSDAKLNCSRRALVLA